MARRPDAVVSVADLVPQLNVPRPYLRMILQTLARANVLQSFRGKGGGFALNLPPERIRLVDIIETFQGPFDLSACMFGDRPCRNRETCPLRKTIKAIEAHAFRTLRKTTIASLVDN